MTPVRWGILGSARISSERIIPALCAAPNAEVVAIASRSKRRARSLARLYGVRRHYDDYDALLRDDEVDVIYNPLPNALHVPMSMRAIRAGKHVLCEKPLATTTSEAALLASVAASSPHLKVMEALMYRHHPQWAMIKGIISSGELGPVRSIESSFSYRNLDPRDIRNQPALGGGGLLDIGSYLVSLSRFIVEDEPLRVLGVVELDPKFGIDRRTSAVLDFREVTSTFTCATQLSAHQRLTIEGAHGRLEIPFPIDVPRHEPARLIRTAEGRETTLTVPIVDQYQVMLEAMSDAVLHDHPVPVPLADAVANLRVIDALRSSAERSSWVGLT